MTRAASKPEDLPDDLPDDGMASNREASFLREAIRLSIENVHTGRGGPFGAVVVHEGQVVGRGTNLVTSTHDPTAHAEIVAIRDACRQIGNFSLDGCEIYSSCEPCPLCLAAIFWARMAKVFYAADCEDAAAAGFDDRVFYEQLARPKDQRSITMKQLLRDEAVLAFESWERQTDRVRY